MDHGEIGTCVKLFRVTCYGSKRWIRKQTVKICHQFRYCHFENKDVGVNNGFVNITRIVFSVVFLWFFGYTSLYCLWIGPTGMYYLSLDKPPRALSDWEKHKALLVSWLEFCLFWLLGWLTAWTAASCLLLGMAQQHGGSACVWILFSMLAHTSLPGVVDTE